MTTQMDGMTVSTDYIKTSFLLSNDLFKNVLLILTIVLLTLYIRRRKKDLPNFPGGPKGIPVLGYIPFLGSTNTHLKLHQIGQEYDGMYSIQLGNKNILVLSSFSSIKEAFSNPAFLGRPDEGTFAINDNHTGFIDQNGERWKEQRFFCQKILQALGATSTCVENLLSQEISHVFDILKEQNSKPLLIEPLLFPSIGNCLSTLLYGKRYDYSDPQRHRMDNCIFTITTSAKLLSLFICLPFGRLLRRLSSTYMEGVRDQVYFYKEIREEMMLNEERFDGNHLKTFLEYYLNEVKKNGADESGTFTRESLVGNVWMYSSAGYETVGNSLHWLFLTVAKFPEVQERVRKEIHEIIGKERMPTWKDRYMMPYTRAVITEIQRWRTIVPLNIYRMTTEDTHLRGFDIPKGTFVLAVLHSAHHDKDYWSDPEEFRPERFLSEDGNTFLPKEAFIPFSFGRRGCPGKIFASITLFFYFTSLLQKYQVESADRDIDVEGVALITMSPKPQKLVFRLLDK